MERLLVECVINYHHFGGPEIVWRAFPLIVKRANPNIILRTYEEMHLKYPYANAIGYILECLKCGKAIVDKWLRLVNRELRFYLFLGDAQDRTYVDKWSIYVPQRFHPLLPQGPPEP
jgi:hypothetical protein